MSGGQSGAGSDPSMEEILASIRRILNEDEHAQTPAPIASSATSTAAAPPPAGPARPMPEKPIAEPADDVFALDPSMMVPEPPASGHGQADDPPGVVGSRDTPRAAPPTAVPPVAVALAPPVQAPPELPREARTLVAPEAAAAAAHAVGSLRRTLESGRASLAVRSGGPTLEDIVREELRPILKAWLDAHLPAVVERLVQAEIERVVSRADL